MVQAAYVLETSLEQLTIQRNFEPSPAGGGEHRRTVVLRYENGGYDMATLDWSQCPAVESIPGKVSGAWVSRGTRVPVLAIFENLKTSPMEEVLENFDATRDQVQAVLDLASMSTQPTPTPLQSLRVG
jgi:uncharacterized protein (DUF433 family)